MSFVFETNKESSSGSHENQYISNGSGSYACVLFGIFMIWLSSIILHLGMTLIGSDAKQFYNYKIRNCFLVIGDKQTYILYIMWILLTAVSLALTIIYVKRIYKDVSQRKFRDKANFFITSPSFYEQKKKGCGLASDDTKYMSTSIYNGYVFFCFTVTMSFDTFRVM